jgi:hypothetical protein
MTTKLQVRMQAAGELACRPGSVHPLARADGHPSRTAVAGSLMRSTREHRAGRPRSLAQARRSRGTALLTLLQVGFTEPPQSPAALVVSYTTVSPLPPGRSPAAVCFLWHYPAGHPGSALPTTLPCGARTFLVDSGEPDPTRPPGQLTRRLSQSRAQTASHRGAAG